MFKIKLKGPGRRVIVAVAGVIALSGAVAFGILETFTVNRLISKAKQECAALASQTRDNAVVCAVYRNGSAGQDRSRKLTDQAESVLRKLWIIRVERRELVKLAEEMSAAEKLLVRKDFEGALVFCDRQARACQSQFDDLFSRLLAANRYSPTTEKAKTPESDSQDFLGSSK